MPHNVYTGDEDGRVVRGNLSIIDVSQETGPQIG